MSYQEAAKAAAACEANFKPDQLSPEAAVKCLSSMNADNQAAVRALKSSGPAGEKRAEEILSTASAIDEFSSKLVMIGSPEKLRAGIVSLIKGKRASRSASALSKSKSVVAKYGFLENVGDTVKWIQKYSPARLGIYQQAAYEYAVLEAERQDYLVRRTIERREWDATRFSARLEVMAGFADSVADKYMAVSPAKMDQAKFDAMSMAFRDYAVEMTPLKRRLFMQHIRTSRRIMNARKEVARQEEQASTEEQKAHVADLAAKVDSIAVKAPEAQLAALGSLFDLSKITDGDSLVVDLSESTSSVRSGEEPPAQEPAGLGAEQRAQVAARLQERISGEISGTKAGDAIMKFYGDPKYAASGLNTLRVAIKPASDSIGFWDGSEVSFGQEFVERWMAEKGYTASDLLTKETPMVELTRLLAPNFIHEATHQRQDAWAADKGVPKPPQQDLEVEAFSMGGLFVMEKARQQAAAGNGSYSAQICEDHLRRAVDFKKGGVIGAADEIDPLYQGRLSATGSSARNTAIAESLYSEMQSRLRAKAAAPAAFAAAEAARRDFPAPEGRALDDLAAALTADDIRDLRTPVLQALLEKPFKWYEPYGAKRATDVQWILSNRRALLSLQSGPSGGMPPLR